MPLSRLRLRLALRSAGVMLLGLLVLDLALYGYLRERAAHRLTRDLQGRAAALIDAVHQEMLDNPAGDLASASREVMREWTAPPGGYQIFDSAQRTLAERGPGPWMAAWHPIPLDSSLHTLTLADSRPLWRVTGTAAGPPRFSVAVIGNAGGVAEDDETLAWWLGLSALALLLLGLGGGYLVSRGALAPIDALGDAMARISPTSLGERLTTADPPDEIDRLRGQFNSLLERLDGAQQQNRRFLREAAHQIRTPLTLVMGEASLALSRPAEDQRAVLPRIQRAAEQMQRRVDDLFLLAEAQAGATPVLDQQVDLEELALETADAMRVRAHQLGRRLAFREVAPVTVTGHRGLLREAMLELLENALRHGDAAAPVEIGVEGGVAPRIVVASAGGPFSIELPTGLSTGELAHHGLGLTIVRWIVELHHGKLELTTGSGSNEVAISFPPG